MKNNTDDLKSHLRKALVSAPEDHSLSEVRSCIVRAIEMVEEVEHRRGRRQASQDARSSRNVYFPSPHASFSAIERELQAERAKLQEIKLRRAAPRGDSPEDQEEMQNVFG